MVKDAIEQNFMGSQGLFRQSNIASRRLYNVKQWKEMCDSEKYRTPNFFNAPEEEKESIKPTKRPRKVSSSTTSTLRTTSSTRGKRGRGRGRGRGRAGKRNAAVRKDGSPAPSVASEQTEATTADPEEGENEDVGLEKLQDADAADAWEENLKRRKQQEDEERNRSAAAHPATSIGEGDVKMEETDQFESPQTSVKSRTNHPAQFAENADSTPSQMRSDIKAAQPQQPVPFPSMQESSSASHQSSMASMPWQPTQFAWQPTHFNAGAGKPAQGSPSTSSFKQPASPAAATSQQTLPADQEGSATKIPAKRYIREEQSQTWDQQWETFDYTTLPYGTAASSLSTVCSS